MSTDANVSGARPEQVARTTRTLVHVQGARAQSRARAPRRLRTEPVSHVAPSVFIAAGQRERGRIQGFGFAALARRAVAGEGPLTMRHVQAGLRLIGDAEGRAIAYRAWANAAGDVSAPEACRGRTGGLAGVADDAARRLRRVRMRTDPIHWSMAWMLCVEGAPLCTLRERFGLGVRSAGARFAAALEPVAAAYEQMSA